MAYLLYGIVKDPGGGINYGKSKTPPIVRGNDRSSAKSPANSGDTIRISSKSGHVSELAGAVPELWGVKGKPVIFVAAHGLCAAVSELEAEAGAPPVAELLAYAQIVEDLHRRQAIVPMRYGCFLNGIKVLHDVLKARQRQYETLLAELEGHVEMGIRILLSEKDTPARRGETLKSGEALSPATKTAPPGEEPASDGRAYLARRKVHYRMQEETSRSRQALIDRYFQAFTGLYAKYRAETDVKKDVAILSLYFLIPAGVVKRFRDTFGAMLAKENDEAMLSGPWPPYNFAAPANLRPNLSLEGQGGVFSERKG